MKNIFLLILLMVFTASGAQDILRLDDAVAIALKKNYDILIARNDADISKINNTAGNAGMLPDLMLNGSGNLQSNNVHQELSGGSVNNYTPLKSTNLSAGAELSWTIFDGGKMFVSKSKLNEIEALGEIQFKEQVLQTIYEVIAGYYDLVRQKQQLASINEVLNFNTERLKIAKTGYEAGSLLKQDFLQAKIDFNITKENIVNQKFVIVESKKALMLLLGENDDLLFEVSDSIPLNYSPDRDSLHLMIYSSNPRVLAFQKQTDIANLSVRENNRLYAPSLNFKAGYYYSQTDNSAGTTLQNRYNGPLLGGSLSIPIYNSGETRRKIDVAKMQMETAGLELQLVKKQVSTDLQNALTDFENQHELLKIEEENNLLTKENLEISLQRLRLGQTTSLEVHQSQEYYVQSCTRLINLKYNVKMAETRLKQLVGEL
ncbi:MAG: TolC family protein [Bacteroidales bacterium]|nr:TolC family protein [Bacteroidales bacterium]